MVFFSGTDSTEIEDNSEFHNIYLSLIVNNRNEMCAKIAFRAKTKIDIEYRDQKGELHTKTLTAEEGETTVYIYDCDIYGIVPDGVAGLDEKIEAIEKKKYPYRSGGTGSSVGFSWGNWQGGSSGNRSSDQRALFQDDETTEPQGTQTGHKRGEKEPSARSTKGQGRVQGSKIEKRLHDYLLALLQDNADAGGTLTETMRNIQQSWEELGDAHLDAFLDLVQKNTVAYFEIYWPDDTKYLGFGSVMEDAAAVMDEYERRCPTAAMKLADMFRNTIVKDDNKVVDIEDINTEPEHPLADGSDNSEETSEDEGYFV